MEAMFLNAEEFKAAAARDGPSGDSALESPDYLDQSDDCPFVNETHIHQRIQHAPWLHRGLEPLSSLLRSLPRRIEGPVMIMAAPNMGFFEMRAMSLDGVDFYLKKGIHVVMYNYRCASVSSLGTTLQLLMLGFGL